MSTAGMSGFEIVGVVLGVQSMLTQCVPEARKGIEALCHSERIGDQIADSIFALFDEFSAACKQLQHFSHSTPAIIHPDMAADFARLFADFPSAVVKVLSEGERLNRISAPAFMVSSHKLEECVEELARLLRRVSRRVTLLACFIQQNLVDAPTVLGHVLKRSRPIYLSSAYHNPSNPLPPELQPQSVKHSSKADPEDLEGGELIEIGLSVEDYGSHLKIGHNGHENGVVLIERRSIKSKVGYDAARDFAEKLSAMRESWPGLLPYHASKWNYADHSWPTLDIIYRYPPMSDQGLIPQTLRSVLPHEGDPEEGPHPNQPLNVRLRLARQVASAVFSVHATALVHKNIRPESILLFSDSYQTPYADDRLGNAFLVGFDKSRGSKGETIGTNYLDAWDVRMYHPPTRDGIAPTKYATLYDIYALGVVLLQIGLWRSFVGSLDTVDEYDNDDGFVRTVTFRKPLYPFDEIPVSQEETHQRLMSCAFDVLAYSMGSAFRDIVVSCLTCMDRQDAVVGARYIEDVLDRLDDVRI